MDMTHEWIRVAMAITGALSIYLGYRLFCDISHQDARAPLSGLLTNLVSGALLAIFGIGILIADFRSVSAAGPESQPASHKRMKATEEGSFQPPRLNKRTNVTERMA